MGIEVSPMMDRRKPNIPRGQVGFIDYIVRPLFVNWGKLFVVTKVCLDNLSANRQRWNELNADPNANNVQFHVEKYRTSKVIDLNQPIKYSPEKAEKENGNGNGSKSTDGGGGKNGDKAKWAQKRSSEVVTGMGHETETKQIEDGGVVGDENVDCTVEMQDVPFTPEQALALHVSLSDQLSSDVEDLRLDSEDGRRRVDTMMD